jgi:hypothetical protein
LASLSWGSQHAWLACKRWALDAAQPSPLATVLFSALGGRDEQQQLVALLAHAEARPGVLFALGFSGNAGLSSVLIEHLASADPVEAKLSALSLSLLFGFDLSDEAYALPPKPAPAPAAEPEEAAAEEASTPEQDAATAEASEPTEDVEADEALPPLEEDDLDADLVPGSEAQLPLPNVQAITQFCAARALPGDKRVLRGELHTSHVLARALKELPLWLRHALAKALGVQSGGALWLDTHAPTSKQFAQLSAVASTSLARFTRF